MILDCTKNFFRIILKIILITGYFYMNMQAYLLIIRLWLLFIKRLSILIVPEFF